MHRGINLISNGNHVRTTLALEKVFWESIDEIFGKNWRHWVIEQLNEKPGEISNSSWIRQQVLKIHKSKGPMQITITPDPYLAKTYPFMKIIMDRVAPISSFEKQSSIEPIQINICSIGPDGKADEPFDTQVISYNTDTITEQ